MAQRPRGRFYTAAESTEIWDRWRKGEGLKSIGRVFGKSSGSIFSHLMPFGGIRPRPRRRSRLALTLVEREEISRGVINGHSLRVIAASLRRAASTVSREVARNGGMGQYRAAASEKRAWVQALRPKLCKLATHPALRRVVARLLRRNWSPQQIAGWLKRNHPDEEAFWVSHETIYRSLFVQARGVLKKQLIEHLRSHHPIRRSRHATAKADLRGRIPDTVSIRERPAEAEDRAVPGHWEGDLLCGSANSYLVTLVERQTRYLMLAKIANRDTHSVVTALIKQAQAVARGTVPLPDLGSRRRTHRPQALHPGDRRHGVLLRSAKSLAARLEREHQSLATTIFPKAHGPFGSLSGQIE